MVIKRYHLSQQRINNKKESFTFLTLEWNKIYPCESPFISPHNPDPTNITLCDLINLWTSIYIHMYDAEWSVCHEKQHSPNKRMNFWIIIFLWSEFPSLSFSVLGTALPTFVCINRNVIKMGEILFL